MKKPRIEPDDRRDLVAYFSGAAFARLAASSLGPMLERMARWGASRPCPVCGGVGQLDGTDRMRARAEKEAGKRRADRAWVVADQKPRRVSIAKIPHLAEYRALRERAATDDGIGGYARAERYRTANALSIAKELEAESVALGDVEVDALRREIASLRAGEELKDATWCMACGGARLVGCSPPPRHPVPCTNEDLDRMRRYELGDGNSWIRPVWESEVIEVHESRRSLGVDLGDQELERLGRIGGRLRRVEEIGGRILVEALGRMHAPGASGGAASVLPITPAGRSLAASHAGEWSDDPTPDQVLDRVRARQREAPDVRTGSRLVDARRQAEELVERAVTAWAQSSRPQRPVADAQRPARPRVRAPGRPEVTRLAELVREALRAAGGEVA